MTDPLTWEDPPINNDLPAYYNLPLASFPFPVVAPNVDPDDICNGDTICVEYRAEWYPFVAGAISQLLQPSTWAGTHDERILALNRAELLKSILTGGQDMSRLCGCEPIQYRYTSDGRLEQSTDGGVTWTPAPGADPRVSGTLFPPLEGADGTTKRCKAADNIVVKFQGIMEQSADEVDASGDIVELLAVVAGVAAVFTGFFTPFGVAIIAFASEALEFGADSIRAAFDSDVWDRFRCNLYCHMAGDGSINQAQLDQIWEQIEDDETGIVVVLLRKAIAFLGVVGMTNAGRIGSGDGTDCGGCGCECVTEQIYEADSDDFTGGTVGNNGPYTGRFVGTGETLTLEIPDRAGRTVNKVFVWWTGISGASGSYTLSVGGQASDESPVIRTGLESPTNTLTPSVDDDTVSFALSGAVSYHVHAFTIFYDC